MSIENNCSLKILLIGFFETLNFFLNRSKFCKTKESLRISPLFINWGKRFISFLISNSHLMVKICTDTTHKENKYLDVMM